MESLFRPCVLGVISNERGEVLIAERMEPRGAWQFPQGGIDPGESPEVAIRREIFEELAISAIQIISRAREPVRYEFPPNMTGSIAQKYRGQEQIWFHLRCHPSISPDLEKATDKEFVAYTWVSVQEALTRIVDFKKSAYKRGLELLGLLQKD
jgi:putative (di)nucleoside polyphosphate hydrolase